MTAPTKPGNFGICIPGKASKGIPLSLRGKQVVGSISLRVVVVSLKKVSTNERRSNKHICCPPEMLGFAAKQLFRIVS